MALSGATATGRICGHTFIPRLLSADSIVVDLGVNQGEFAQAILQRFGCRVYGAEPTPELCARLNSAVGLSVLPVAIGGRDGRATLNTYVDKSSSVLARPKAARLDQVQVDVMTLPAFLDHFSLRHVDLIKIDIEGAELEVFASTPDLVWRRCKQITVEFHDFMYPSWRPAVAEVGRRLVALGFYRINMSLDNTDVLFVNRRLTDFASAEYLYLKFGVKYALGLARVVRRALASTKRRHSTTDSGPVRY